MAVRRLRARTTVPKQHLPDPPDGVDHECVAASDVDAGDGGAGVARLDPVEGP